MPKPSVALICAPSGTKLSTIARNSAEPDHPEAVQDLEERLCLDYRGHPSHRELGLQQDEVPSMWHVVRRPREELYNAWKKALQECLEICADQHDAQARLLFMHLSWYQPDTTQYFSSVSVSHLKASAESSGCQIRHVVILIDDIYDMYTRLQGPNDIYKLETIAARADRLHGLHRRPESDAASRRHSKLEAVESALAQLISWRQHEILQAEDIARELGAHFTVIGVKHSRQAFECLVRSDVPYNTYLSHRISEGRVSIGPARPRYSRKGECEGRCRGRRLERCVEVFDAGRFG